MVDLRTRYGRMLKRTREDLWAHVGGAPTATQKHTIERVAQLAMRLAMMDDRAASGVAMTDCDNRTYLAWSNTLTRTLARLGPGVRGVDAPPSLAAYVQARGA